MTTTSADFNPSPKVVIEKNEDDVSTDAKPTAAFATPTDDATNVTTAADAAPTGLRAILSNFCSETSAHGLPHLVKYRNWSLKRCTWLVIFCLAMIGEFTHLALLLRQYLEYPSSDSFRVSKQQPKFPAITVCNTHPVSELGWLAADSETFNRYLMTSITLSTIFYAVRSQSWRSVDTYAK